MPDTITTLRIGPFTLLDELGAGGMATVWRAKHELLDVPVAVKVMRGGDAREELYKEYFRREVQAVASLNHPNVVRVWDYGEIGAEAADTFAPGSPYLVMEIADQGTLERHQPRSWGGLRRVVLQVLDALAYAHARGVVHRDIKPDNVLFVTGPTGRLRAKLTDFGIARAMPGEGPQKSGEETVGTFQYMPPEQFHGEWRDYGPWTDLYSLGCTVWRLATGELPFVAKTPFQLAVMHLESPPPEFRPRFDVPDGLEAWLRRLLQKRWDRRYACAADAAFAFHQLDPGFRDTAADSGEFFPDAETVQMTVFGTEVGATTVFDAASKLGIDSRELESGASLALRDTARKHVREYTDPARNVRPPHPATWRRPDVGYLEDVAGMGLGLFGLREIPFVDRDEDRTAIWEALREVHESSRPRTIFVRGASGTGKSRLVAWMCQRAEEVGSAVTLRTSAARSATGALAQMVDRHFATWGREGAEEVVEIVRGRIDDGTRAGDFVDAEARALAAVCRPVEPRPSRAERIATIGRLIERVASKRPVVLWIDDIQWDAEAIELVGTLMSQEAWSDLPLLILATVQEEALTELPAARDALGAVRELHGVDERVLQPLAAEDHAELVGKLIGLEAENARFVSDATVGNPLFAIQLVGDWVERGVLRPTPDGFTLDESASAPDDLHALWERRIDDVVGRLGGFSQLVALELAAIAGLEVDRVEWRAACAVAGHEPSWHLIDTLIDLGMARRVSGGWAFVHALLVESLRRRARSEGRWDGLHEVWAKALEVAADTTNAETLSRLAIHHLEAGNHDEAFRRCIGRVDHEVAGGEVALAEQWLDRAASALRGLGVSMDDPRAVELTLWRGLVAWSAGDRGGIADVRSALTSAEELKLPLVTAHAHVALGDDASIGARLDEALQHFRLALEALDGVDAPLERATAIEKRSWVLKSIGRAAEAREDLEAALDLRRAAGDSVGELNVINQLAFTLLAEGDYDGAREVAQVGIEVGREIGHRTAEAGCWTTLGEIERFEGDFEASRESYRRAEELDELCGTRHVHLVRSNALMTEVGAGHWEESLPRLDETEAAMVAIGFGWILPFMNLARAACMAGLGRWDEFDRYWRLGREQIAENGITEIDLAWIAEVTSGACVEGGDVERAIAAQEYAVEVWAVLDDRASERAARIELERLRRVSAS